MTNYQRTAAWLKSCGKEPGNDSASLQVGVVLEEFAELTACLRVSQDGWQIVLERLTSARCTRTSRNKPTCAKSAWVG